MIDKETSDCSLNSDEIDVCSAVHGFAVSDIYGKCTFFTVIRKLELNCRSRTYKCSTGILLQVETHYKRRVTVCQVESNMYRTSVNVLT